jgi:hypothetical protein
MARLPVSSVIVLVLGCASLGSAQWSQPQVLWPEVWDDPGWFDLDESGQHLVALIPHSGTDDNSRHVVVTERIGGVWQTPVILATNGTYSEEPFQVLPTHTVPEMAGDGGTLAFVGWDGASYSIYVSDRDAGGWSTPTALPTGLDNHHYQVSLSRDGDTIALCNYPFMATQHVYVLRRSGGVWGAPVQVSGDTGDVGGCWPSLDATGTRLVYVANARLQVVHSSGGVWGAPVALTDNVWWEHEVEFPQVSADGSAITYWLVDLVDNGSAYVRVAQNLLQVRRRAGGWGPPVQVNAAPVLPVFVYAGPAAANASATRLVYPREVMDSPPVGDPSVIGCHLEVSELGDTGWVESRLVEYDGYGNYNKLPWLAPDGLDLVFEAGIRYTPTLVYSALWSMSTAVTPPDPFTIFADGFESGDPSAWSESP